MEFRRLELLRQRNPGFDVVVFVPLILGMSVQTWVQVAGRLHCKGVDYPLFLFFGRC